MRLIVSDNFAAASRTVADMFEDVVRKKPDALLGLATGGSVTELYKYFVADSAGGLIDFSACSTVNLDEYIGIPQSNPQSFAYFMRNRLFDKAGFDKNRTYLVDGSENEKELLEKYNRRLENSCIDILLLGVGANGHIGFNEPQADFVGPAHSVSLSQQTIEANARFFSDPSLVPRRAFTMGVRDMIRAKKVVLIASGEAKAKAIKKLFSNDRIDPMLPCSIIKLCSDAAVVVDRELARAAGLEG